jgi:hypothetical protein
MENFSYDQYLFLDGDTIVLDDPTGLFSGNANVMLSPVNSKGVGIIDIGDSNGAYWKELYNLASVETETIPRLKTVEKEEEILAYWNSGVILFNGNHGICNKWKILVDQVLSKKIYPLGGIFFVEQTCLSAVLMNSKYNIDQISLQANFPLTKNCLHHFDEINLDEIAILHHYQNLDLIINRKIRIIGQDKEIWIRDQVARLQLDPKDFTGRIASSAQALHMKLMEKFYFFVYRINAK